jgi:short subunit dehydrogenase-like uncharacterized protein
MSSGFMLYGSTGYTGSLIARLAVERGLRPILAARNSAKVKRQARDLGLDYRIFDLNDVAAIERAVGEVGTVLHCAGPFIYTAKPMVEACLKVVTNYLDISGEIPVFEMLAGYTEAAVARGITVLPGVGTEIVSTDCLAAHLKRRLPSATHLTLAWGGKGPANFSRGSSLTMVEHSDLGGRVRRDGRLETVPAGWKSRMIDLGCGPVKATTFPWPDVFSAFYSTRIPNIEIYYHGSREMARMIRAEHYLRPLLSLTLAKDFMRRGVRTQPIGPTDEERARTRTLVWGEVRDDHGQTAVSRLEGPQGYTWTAITALGTVQKVLEGLAPTGFQTPALAFGADFVLECGGATRRDVT